MSIISFTETSNQIILYFAMKQYSCRHARTHLHTHTHTHTHTFYLSLSLFSPFSFFFLFSILFYHIVMFGIVIFSEVNRLWIFPFSRRWKIEMRSTWLGGYSPLSVTWSSFKERPWYVYCRWERLERARYEQPLRWFCSFVLFQNFDLESANVDMIRLQVKQTIFGVLVLAPFVFYLDTLLSMVRVILKLCWRFDIWKFAIVSE